MLFLEMNVGSFHLSFPNIVSFCSYEAFSALLVTVWNALLLFIYLFFTYLGKYCMMCTAFSLFILSIRSLCSYSYFSIPLSAFCN